MRINHNVTAMNTSNNLYNVNNSQAKVLEKLGSGQRINRASDDSAGLAISEKMRGELAVLKQSKSNQQDLVAFSNAQDGALNEISNILVNMQQLITQKSGSATISGSVMMNEEAKANIDSSMDAFGDAAKGFMDGKINGINLLDGGALNLVGASDPDGALTTLKGLGSASTLANLESAATALNKLRASIGAQANKAEATVRNIATQIENLQEAESRIRDTDMADMTIDFQKNNILNNAATSMLAQANQQPQSVLQLLR